MSTPFGVCDERLQRRREPQAILRILLLTLERAMEPLFYVMAIMGCGDAGEACRQARVEPVRYASAAQCQVAMAEALQRNSDLSFPVITAACQQRGEQVAQRTPARRKG